MNNPNFGLVLKTFSQDQLCLMALNGGKATIFHQQKQNLPSGSLVKIFKDHNSKYCIENLYIYSCNNYKTLQVVQEVLGSCMSIIPFGLSCPQIFKTLCHFFFLLEYFSFYTKDSRIIGYFSLLKIFYFLGFPLPEKMHPQINELNKLIESFVASSTNNPIKCLNDIEKKMKNNFNLSIRNVIIEYTKSFHKAKPKSH